MLNILNLKKNKIHLKPTKIAIDERANSEAPNRHYPTANQDWFNSIYAYNKNTPRLLPVASKTIVRLFKSYFNMYSKMLEKKIRARYLARWKRRLSLKRILVSRAELKHTSDKVIITLYIYNGENKYYINKLNKVPIPFMLLRNKKKKVLEKVIKKVITFKFLAKTRLVKIKTLKILKKIKQKSNMLLKKKTPDWNRNILKNYVSKYYVKFFNKSLYKERRYLYFKQILALNKFKFANTYLLPFKSLIEKIYNKKVEFNLVNTKYLHLNSDLLSDTIALRLRVRKNRVLRVLKNSLLKKKIKPTSIIDLPSIDQPIDVKPMIRINKLNVNSLIHDISLLDEKMNNKDPLQHLMSNFTVGNTINLEKKVEYLEIYKDYHQKIDSCSNLLYNETVFYPLKHKLISGIRLEASGRLTWRITAARSVSKVRYIGNLRNLDSSFRKMSSVFLKGHVRSNIQFTKSVNKTKIGAFGIKGWVSSL